MRSRGVDETGTVANDECPSTCEGSVMDFDALGVCEFAYINGDTGFFEINREIPLFLAYSGEAEAPGSLTVRLNAEGQLEVSADLFGITNFTAGYEITVIDFETYCQNFGKDLRDDPESINDVFAETYDIFSRLWLRY